MGSWIRASLCRAGLALVALCGLPSEAAAAPITFVFTGEVTYAIDGYGFEGVEDGAPLTVRYTIDPTRPDLAPDPGEGLYVSQGEPFGMVAQIGDLTLEGPDEFNDFISGTQVSIVDGAQDRIAISTRIPFEPVEQNGFRIAGSGPFGVNGIDPSGAAISSDALVWDPAVLSQFEFTLGYEPIAQFPVGPNFSEFTSFTIVMLISGPLELTVVPEPSTATLVGGGLLLIAIRQRRLR